MKKWFLLILMMLALGSPAYAQTWTPIASPSELTNYAAFFTDSATGVITNWRFDAGGQSAEIYRTGNGGGAWSQSFNFGGALFAVAFADKLNGTAVGGDPGCICGGIYRTTDGGASWTPQSTAAGSTPSLYAVHYVNENIGFLGGDDGVLMKTTNGGASWYDLNSGTQGVIRSIHFADPDNGFMIVAQPENSLQGQAVFKTTNGGTSWTSETFDNNTFVPMSVWFVSPKVGFIGGNGGRPVIIKTTDGGKTWAEKFRGGTSGTYVLSMQFVNPYVGYAVGGDPNFTAGDKGGIFSTTDGGDTWKVEQANYPKALRWVHFPTETVGYAVGDGGTILKTTRKAFTPPQPTIKVSRESLDFGAIEVGGNRSLSFDVSPTNTAGLHVEHVLLSGEAAAAGYTLATAKPLPLDLAAGEKLTVSVTFSPTKAGAATAELSIETNDAATAAKKIALTGNGTAAPEPALVASAEELGFGEVPVGSAKEMLLGITALNGAGLAIDSVYLAGSGLADLTFTASPSFPTTIGEGDAMTIKVRYAPQSESAIAGDLVVKTNDPAHRELHVPLSGQGLSVASVPGAAGAAMMEGTIEPNPANARALLRLTLHERGRLRVELYDERGVLVRTLADESAERGEREMAIATEGLAAGVYHCRVSLGSETITRQLVVVR